MTYKFLEQRLVSHKTPRDGRLEISAAAAALLGSIEVEFPVMALRAMVSVGSSHSSASVRREP
jgi:hypothetical protein